MATIRSRVLFFTTSPRTPLKMIPEIKLLVDNLTGKPWDTQTQKEFMNLLVSTDFYEGGSGSTEFSDFSARDRINRAPKSLGFVSLKPTITLTEVGSKLVSGERTSEVFTRQLLKFQLPSPFHLENDTASTSFFVKPYLEIIRLTSELKYLTFDECKIFALQITDYHNFDNVRKMILDFRVKQQRNKSNYKKFIEEVWTDEVIKIYHNEINDSDFKTRESNLISLKKFISTKKSNMRDYTDACFRYLRATGLVSLSYMQKSITISSNKLNEVDFILKNISRDPIHINDEEKYKEYLYGSKYPELFNDIQENIINDIIKFDKFELSYLRGLDIETLKDIKDKIIEEYKLTFLQSQVKDLKSFNQYSDIIDTFNLITNKDVYDAPLVLEWNTWRAMTMINSGNIVGNFTLDDFGEPLSTAQGNMPDIECDYGDFALSVEVTLQSGQRQYESESEPVARHLAKLGRKLNKDAYCLFITPKLNEATIAHFFLLNKTPVHFYGGTSKIIPLSMEYFICLIDNSYNHQSRPDSNDIRRFLDNSINHINTSTNEIDWIMNINNEAMNWLK